MKKTIMLMILIILMMAGCSADQSLSSLEEGIKYLEQGEYEKAAAAFDKAVEEDPQNAVTYLERGKFYLEHGLDLNGSYSEEMFQNILSDCRKAQELDPKNEESAACIFYAYAQNNQYTEAAESLKNYIDRNDSASESIKDIMAKADNGQITDIHNNVRIYTAYDDAGKIRYAYHYNYDRLDRIESLDWYSADGTLKDHIRYIYDEKGKVTQGVQTTDAYTGEMTAVYYAYDEKGNLITEIWENFNGNPYKRTYHYDDKGMNDYMQDLVGGEVITTHKRYYDSAGNMILEETYSSNDDLISKVEYIFNEKNMCTEQTMYDRDGKVSQQWYFTYDENDKLIRTEYYVDGQLIDIKGS